MWWGDRPSRNNKIPVPARASHWERKVSRCKHARRDKAAPIGNVCPLTPTKAVTHQEAKVYLVIKMQSLLLCPLERQWQRTHPGSLGARGATCTAAPPAPPLPPFIKPGIYTMSAPSFPPNTPPRLPPPSRSHQQPRSSLALVRRRFIRINVALQRRVSVRRVPGCQEKESPARLCHIE